MSVFQNQAAMAALRCAEECLAERDFASHANWRQVAATIRSLERGTADISDPLH
jgi:hypothetical protein